MLPGEIDGKQFLRAVIVAFHDSLSRNSVRRALREAGIDEDAFESEL